MAHACELFISWDFSTVACQQERYNRFMFRAFLHDSAYRHATAALIGTMVGVGIFGVPFAFAKAGFWVGLAWLIGLAVVVVLFYLMFAEMMLRTQGEHQLVGYADRWLGPTARRTIVFTSLLSIYGALLAYTIVISQYLHNVLSQYLTIDPQMYSILFTVVLAPIILFRLRTVASIELTLTLLFVAVVLIITAAGIWHINPANYTYTVAPYWFLPYGVILFAFSGITALPTMRRILVNRERRMKPAIIVAVVLTAVLYALFAAVVVGVSGEVTSPDALAGLFDFLGLPIVIIGSLFGILTISSSYILVGTALYEIFHTDYGTRPWFAWPLTVIPPIAFFFSGLRNFIDVIGTVGAVALGLQSIVFIVAYLRRRGLVERKPEWTVRVPTFVLYILIVAFASGLGYALWL
jgi:amino acid permease